MASKNFFNGYTVSGGEIIGGLVAAGVIGGVCALEAEAAGYIKAPSTYWKERQARKALEAALAASIGEAAGAAGAKDKK